MPRQGRTKTATRDALTPAEVEKALRAVFGRIQAGWEIGPEQAALLVIARDALGRWIEAKRVIDAQGLIVHGTRGPKANPAVAMERDSRKAVADAIARLGLRDE